MLARFDMHELSLSGLGFLRLSCYQYVINVQIFLELFPAVHRALNKTQPVPNPIAFYLHKSPEIIHKFEVLGNHFVELIAPVFIILPFRKLRIFSSLSVIFFMTVIGLVQKIHKFKIRITQFYGPKDMDRFWDKIENKMLNMFG